VRVSLQVFGLPGAAYVPVARRAEKRGFHAIWLADHLVTPTAIDSRYPYSPSGKAAYAPETPLADVLLAASGIAAVTSQLRIGTGVFILPLRNVISVARSVETLQSISDGRFLFGIGTGWLREEYNAVGERFNQRGARFDEMLDVMNLLWSGKPTSFDGEFYSFDEIVLAPPAKAPPLYFGGSTPKALARAARVGQGWFGPACTLEESVEVRDGIEAERARLGRDGRFDYAVRLDAAPGPAVLDRFAAAGFDHVVVSLGSAGPAPGDELAAVDRLADALQIG
jgi:probable F420-dependent oxidoreductase